MNIFYLHPAPDVAASYLHDKHVVKMILESAQILSTVHARYGKPCGYKATHPNHPSTRWAGDSVWHYQWLFQHAMALCGVYTRTYGRTHATQSVLALLERPPVGLHTTGWQPPPQAMPDEFKVDGDSIAAYRNYYLARKVVQSKWTRRDVPPFVLLGEPQMATAKKTAPKSAPVAAAKKAAPAKVAAPVVEDAVEVTPRTRGPRGVPESAVITVLVDGNPKREGSKAHAVFSHYETGMTIADFCAALEATDAEMVKEATPNLVYDAKHGFIEIDGYTPPGGVVIKEPKAPKAEKPAKAPKAAKKAKAAEAEAEIDEAAEEEIID